MPTGAQIRAAMEKRGLIVRGKTTAAGAVNYLVDTTRMQMSKLSPNEYGDAYVRVVSGDSDNNGYVGQLERLDPVNGRIYVSPSVSATFDSAVVYEIHKYGINPDDNDKAVDRALTERCSMWRPTVLSVLRPVEEWSTSAYSAGSGGETNSAGAVQTLAHPHEYTASAMRITNSGANGILGSEALDVQPGQRFVVWGLVSVRAQTASLRVRNLTAGSDITLSDSGTFTLRGWQAFERTFTIPAGCERIELWPGGASASCEADWAGIGLLPLDASEITLASRVDAKGSVGRVFRYFGGANVKTAADREPYEVACWRDRPGALVRLRFPSNIDGPMFYEERRFYSALRSAYFTATDRTTGDDATTTCPLRYIEAAAVVELLESVPMNEDLNKIYLVAVKDLNSHERAMGAEPMIPPEPARARPRLMGL